MTASQTSFREDIGSSPYLQKLKIDFQAIEKLDAEQQFLFLSEIYLAHIKSFAFHNFELRKISRQHPIQRNTLTMFAEQKRGVNGGFCFQSVQVLYDLLKNLGFTVSRSLARVLGDLGVNSNALLALPATHVILVVKIKDQSFLLDPGLGARAPISPVLVNADKSDKTQSSNKFRLLKQEENLYVLEKRVNARWIPLIQSDLVSVSERELKFALLKLERHPLPLDIRDTILAVGLITDSGSRNLHWDTEANAFIYSVEQNSQYSKRVIKDTFEVCSILNVEFNIKHVSTSDIEEFINNHKMPLPTESWTVDFPLDDVTYQRMGSNLKA